MEICNCNQLITLYSLFWSRIYISDALEKLIIIGNLSYSDANLLFLTYSSCRDFSLLLLSLKNWLIDWLIAMTIVQLLGAQFFFQCLLTSKLVLYLWISVPWNIAMYREREVLWGRGFVREGGFCVGDLWGRAFVREGICYRGGSTGWSVVN